MPKCTNCKKEKPDKHFRKDKRTKSGLSSWCADCQREANRKCKSKRPREEKAECARKWRARVGLSKYGYKPKQKDVENGQSIKNALLKAKMSQRKLAQLLGVSDAVISLWANGKQPVSNSKLMEIISIIENYSWA